MLDALIRRFVQAELSLEEFQDQYSVYYLERIPSAALTEAEWDFYTCVHEKTEWTSPKPDEADRADGWLDESQLRRWLADNQIEGSPP